MNKFLYKILSFKTLLLFLIGTTDVNAVLRFQVNEDIIESPTGLSIAEVATRLESFRLDKNLRIDFRDNEIGNEGVRELLPVLKSIESLEYLSLRNTGITEELLLLPEYSEAVDDFLDILLKLSIRYVDVAGNNFNLESIKALSKGVDKKGMAATLAGGSGASRIAFAKHLEERLIFLRTAPYKKAFSGKVIKVHADYYDTYFRKKF